MTSQDNARSKTTPAGSAVFRYLYRAGADVTKQEAADECGLSLPTVYQAFSLLEEQGLIESGDNRTSTGGRRAQTFRVSRRTAAIGVSLTGHSVRGVACDLYGNRVGELSLKEPLPAERSAATLATSIRDMATELEALLSKDGVEVVGLGIAVPSAIDPQTGRLLNTRVLQLGEAEVHADDLTAGLNHPAAVFNDANCGAFSQVFPDAGEQSLAYLSLERGVGGGLVINGKPFGGPRGTCGEFGHIRIEPGPAGKKCSCGKTGCLEAYCSSDVLSDEQGCTLDEFFSAAKAGDAKALAALDGYIAHLAQGICAIHTALGVDVALGGEMASYLEPWFDRIAEAERAVDPFPTAEPCILRAKHPHHGVPVGAAQLMAARFIESV